MPRVLSLLSIAIAVMALTAHGATAQTIIGDLNNFDTLNDTGQTCYGFEIEIDGIHSTDITYTFDWNHYGPPKIREDNTDPAHPKVFVRYESTKDANGQWGANGSFTNPAIPTTAPPTGHTCTDTSVNEGCEHFGVGYYGTPTTVKYHWLIDDNAGGLVYFGTPVGVATPKWTYTPPPPGGGAAQVVAVIPAPVVPVVGKEFGEPFWVKVIKTTSHSANPIALGDLISDDTDDDGRANWQNGEPDEIETEWKLLQASAGGAGPKDELEAPADDMGDGSEVVTRRYEFYKYAAAANTLDGENGEAMCSEVQPTTDPADPLYLHGVGTSVEVTGADGEPYFVDCEAQVVVGNYIGAQMAGFAAAVPLGLIDHLQDGTSGTPYTPRTVVVGGTAPFTITIPLGSLPPGLSLGPDGVLSGTPSAGGDFSFTVQATDDVATSVSQAYTLRIAGDVGPSADLVVSALSTTATAVTPGATVALFNTVSNQGAAAGPFVIAYRLSADATYGGADDLALAKTRSVASLGAGASSSATTGLVVPASTPPGTYHLCAAADSTAAVPEADEVNNTGCTAATITVARPDLRLTHLQPTAAFAQSGGTLAVDSTVQNDGGLPAGAFAIAFRLSRDAVYGGGDDVAIGTTRKVASLDAGASSPATTILAIPRTVGGTYFVCSKVDSGNAVKESDESDNTLCSASTVELRPSDLAVTALSTAATAVAPGKSFKVSSTVTNNGESATGPFVIAFGLSVDTVYDPFNPGDDIAFAATRSAGSLWYGASSTGTTTLTVPAAAPLGTYFLCAYVDGSTVVGEADETNNLLCTGTTITVTRPDLRMTQVEPNAASASPGGTLSVTSTVENQGDVGAGGSAIAFRLSVNATYGDGDDIAITTKRSVSSVAAGASKTVTTTLAIPSTTPSGTYLVCAQADAGDGVIETDEGSNTLCSGSAITVP